jgi:Methionine synthase I (cobalamin-dependent), methyltransferase domain
MARNVADEIRRIAEERILVLDGAWGVLLQSRGLTEADFRGERFRDHSRDVLNNPDLLNITRPDIVSAVHESYFDAGADIATTNTFTATAIAQADYGLEDAVYDMNVEGARLAREAAGPDRFVAGSVGPLNITLSLSPRVDEPGFRTHTFDQVRETYASRSAVSQRAASTCC